MAPISGMSRCEARRHLFTARESQIVGVARIARTDALRQCVQAQVETECAEVGECRRRRRTLRQMRCLIAFAFFPGELRQLEGVLGGVMGLQEKLADTVSA